ncbi:MAG: hypothetical protein IJI47_01335 [Eubacterium sp.]|nr:hypothetical protein [Eubacterium sp.]MBR0412198.1 hypothetical protein [Eubacterium sp.]
MSNSFKKVIACLLAVLMVMFSVPFTAFALGSDYNPDVRLQFGTLSESAADSESWVSNFSEGSIDQKGKNTSADFTYASLGGPQLVATGSVSNAAKYSITNLKLEASDVDNLLAEDACEAEKASLVPEDVDRTAADFNISDYDYNLQAGDGFTVSVLMNNVGDTVKLAGAEIAYSNNIEPVYVVENGKMSSSTRTVKVGTASQLNQDESEADSLADYSAASLYDGVSDLTETKVKTDYDGQHYIQAELIGDGVIDWSAVTNTDVNLTNADGTYGNTYAGTPVIVTVMFVLKSTPSAENPIEFWVHNGNTEAHTKDINTGADLFSTFMEGYYAEESDDNTATYATYALNKFAGPKAQWGAENPNPGSYHMTFMGKNENVQSACSHEHTTSTDSNVVPATCTEPGSKTVTVTCDDCGETISVTEGVVIPATGHNYVAGVTVAPTCTEQGYTVYTCANGCGESYNGDFTDATGHKWGDWTETTPAVPAGCTTDGTTAIETRVCQNDSNHTETRGGDNIPAPGHSYAGTVTAPTCEEQGYTTYVCGNCGDTYTGDFVPAKGHAYAINSIDWTTLNTETGAVTANYVCANDDTHTKTETVQTTSQVIQQQSEDDPEITRFTYTAGEFSDYKDVQTKNPSGHTTHNYTVPVSIAWDGENATTATVTLKCNKCEATTTTAATVNNVKKSDATCTEAAVYTYTASYDGLDSISKDVSVGVPNGHDLTKTDEVPAGCTTAGTQAYWTCGTCHKMFSDADAQNEIENPVEIPATGHAPLAPVKENEVEPTATTDGGYDNVVYCDNCGNELSREHVVVPASGMTITVNKYDIGTVTVNGEVADGTKVSTFNVKYNNAVTLKVTEDAEYFKGWESNKKIVSTDTEFTTYAYTNMEFTPVFEAPNTNLISVVFYDKFGNEVKAYRNYTVDGYQDAIASEGIPQAPNYPSCEFAGWDIDDNEILGLTASKTIFANYNDVESTKKFTVTVQDAAGADITDTALTLPAGIAKDAVPYDTKATVSNDNAKGWEIDGVVVSTEDTYSFFVGADVTVKMITDDVDALPTTTIIGGNKIDNTYRYNIMATRNVPAGYTLVDYGFVYGKNLTDADLAVENEGKAGTGNNSGNVKVVRAGTQNSGSSEFALNYGIKSAGNYVTAKSFIVVKKGADVQTIYSDMVSYES